MEIAAALRRLLDKRDLEAAEVEALFGRLMDGELTAAQKAGLLIALAAKGENVHEIAGAARAMRARLLPIPHHLPVVVDPCGTGGDGAGTFNISTAAALVAAAAGAKVAKHGNRAASSRSGAADVLEALGVRIDLTPEQCARCQEQVGITFLFAPLLHPAMREVAPVRRELGVRTLFNVLGPLTNPAGARRQLLGVYSAELVDPLAHVLRDLGAEHALVVHGDGLDEITTTGPTEVAEVADGIVRRYRLEPADLGITRQERAALRGGEPAENARRLAALFDGGEQELAPVVVLNAGAALYVAGRAHSLREGIVRAHGALENGAARRTLDALREFDR